jgi:tetratricopeptide (TPR) repeat protein
VLPIAVLCIGAGCAVVPPSRPTGYATASLTPSANIQPIAGSPTAGPSDPTSPTIALVATLQASVRAHPDDAEAWRDLGLAILQRVRETADPSLYAQAEEALTTAHKRAPDDARTLVGIGGLELGRHQFADALETGRQAVAKSPDLAAAQAVVVDALVELGRYDEADAAVTELTGMALDITTLSRYSYLRELHGDLDGAIAAMRQAVAARGEAPEQTAYVEALLGNLLIAKGDLAGAKGAYEAALALVPNHAPSLAGLGRLAVGRNDLETARAAFAQAEAILPLPEYVIALGDVESALGATQDADASYKLARFEISLFQQAGVSVDLDLALFEADHGDPATALRLAKDAYAQTPTVRAADAIAWALHRLGRDTEAKPHADEALRLGSFDPVLRYHAGAIAAALGDVATAREDLEQALATDSGFNALGAAEARRILAGLE